MFAIFGTRNFGKVDHVPGLFYLSTEFFHVNFVPLVPTGTHLVIDGSESGDGFRGVKIGMSGKSIFFTYLRAACVVGSILAFIFGFIDVANGQTSTGVALIAAGIVATVLMILSYKLARPSPERALRLAQEAGIAPEVVAQFFVESGLFQFQDGKAEPYQKNQDEYHDNRKNDR